MILKFCLLLAACLSVFPVLANHGSMLAFNKYVKDKKTDNLCLQIFIIKDSLQ